MPLVPLFISVFECDKRHSMHNKAGFHIYQAVVHTKNHWRFEGNEYGELNMGMDNYNDRHEHRQTCPSPK